MTDNIKEVKITTEFIKLDSFLKFCGAAATGGEAKLMIAGGKVFVDAEPCAMRGKKLRPGMTVEIDGGKEAFRVSGS